MLGVSSRRAPWDLRLAVGVGRPSLLRVSEAGLLMRLGVKPAGGLVQEQRAQLRDPSCLVMSEWGTRPLDLSGCTCPSPAVAGPRTATSR